MITSTTFSKRTIYLLSIGWILAFFVQYTDANAYGIPPLPPTEETINVPQDFVSQESFIFWQNLPDYLRKSTATKITLLDAGFGGQVMLMYTAYSGIKDAAKSKEIVMRAIGPAGSASAFIVCAASKVEIDEGASLYFHGPRSINRTDYIWELFNLTLKDRTQTIPNGFMFSTIFSDCQKKGLLTAEDVTKINAGYGVYVMNVGGTLIKSYQYENFFLDNLLEYLALFAQLTLIIAVLGLIKRI